MVAIDEATIGRSSTTRTDEWSAVVGTAVVAVPAGASAPALIECRSRSRQTPTRPYVNCEANEETSVEDGTSDGQCHPTSTSVFRLLTARLSSHLSFGVFDKNLFFLRKVAGIAIDRRYV